MRKQNGECRGQTSEVRRQTSESGGGWIIAIENLPKTERVKECHGVRSVSSYGTR